MDLHLGLTINKKDVLIILILSVIFLGIALSNLGYAQSPKTSVQLSAGDSFYIDMGSRVNVKSMLVLLKQYQINFTIYTGNPENWVQATTFVKPASSDVYYSFYDWFEIPIGQNTQYLRIDVNQTDFKNTFEEIAIIDQNNIPVPIQSITNLAGTNPNLHNLIDEQNLVHYPVDYMSQTYFDEIYFVQTADNYLHLHSPYEWTHPPLGKLIQAAGIVAFGFSPFGWRIMGVIFGALMIPLIYLLGKALLGRWVGGFAAAFLLTFDFMHFTMARMGTADTYVVFFSLASQLFYFIYLRNVIKDGWKTSTTPLVAAVILFALGFACKWVVLYGFLGELAILIILRLVDVSKVKGAVMAKVYAFLDHPYLTVTTSILLAVGIYFATYIPDMLTGRSFMDVLSLQGSMYEYHAHLTATHAFASPWYSWPLLYDPLHPILNMLGANPQLSAIHVPLWVQGASVSGLNSTIVILGNPAVWWIGFVAMLSLMFVYVPKLFKKVPERSRLSRNFSSLRENWLPLSIVFVFFCQWLPYIFITRVVFIYHFYVCVPLLCLASAFFISKYWDKRWVKLLTVIYFAAVVALFILFYPVLSGVPTTQSTIDSLHWNNAWVF